VSDTAIVLPPFLLEPINDLLACVCAEVAAVKPVCECMIVPGFETAWYYCGECQEGKCGMAWVNVLNVHPYIQFPNPTIDAKCHLPLAMIAQVGVVRCMPMPDSQGNPPAATDLEEATALQLADMWAIYRAVVCCGVTYKAVGQWTSLGPLGDCVGGMWNVHLAAE
jgi:hypothetical protein